MGVPAFFRWLSRKYSSIVVHCKEEKPKEINGVKVPVDGSQPNPNDVEFDNLYLDMNGIIHPCSHPIDRPAPKNEEEIMYEIFDSIDRLFNIVRPRRLLYMAIDGVAPRAKMNQQRSRRFRASKESQESVSIKEKIRAELRSRGAVLPQPDPKAEKFDSNCITPGTEFMHRLANCLRFYVQDRLNNDPGWAKIEVILSDANVPGEGEHKIMDFIRKQRGQPKHDPNTHHCICGADADLIMLGLATHEPNFTIIREEFKPNAPKPCGICSQYGHEMEDCCGLPREKAGEFDELQSQPMATTDYIFIRLSTIREYLSLEMQMPNLPFQYDIENILDDWVMLCFFVGNDFLPHLPSLEIREGAIDKLVKIYKDVVHSTGGYLTKNGIVDLSRVEKIMQSIGRMEDDIFRRRRDNDVRYRERERDKKRTNRNTKPSHLLTGQFAPQAVGRNFESPHSLTEVRKSVAEIRKQNMANSDAAASLRSMLKQAPEKSGKKEEEPTSFMQSLKRKREQMDDEDPDDDVRLWEDGWKERYYRTKFNVSMRDIEFRKTVVRSYVQGLCWVLSYYYQGCASWKWYFPFHYAPFASDFVDIASVPNTFPITTKPKNPLEQLMCVFPAASGQFLPETWRELMSDPESPIIDFYPDDFSIDLNGKKYAWQGVALLPFVDEDRMMKTLETVYPDLTDDEAYRNSLGEDRIFVGKLHPLFTFIKELYEGGGLKSYDEAADINPELTHGMAGKIWRDPHCKWDEKYLASPLPRIDDITCNNALSMCFKDPAYPKGHIFEAKLLPGAILPPPTVKPRDWEERNNRKPWQPRLGFNPNRQRMQLEGSSHRHLNHHLPRHRHPSHNPHHNNRGGGGYNPRGGRGYNHNNQDHYAWGNQQQSSNYNNHGRNPTYPQENYMGRGSWSQPPRNQEPPQRRGRGGGGYNRW